MKKYLTWLVPFLALTVVALMATGYVFAQQAADLSPVDYATQIFQAVQKLGGLSGGLKAIMIINLIIASQKVSFLRAFLWDKMGAAKVLVAPLLGLVVGLIEFKLNGGNKGTILVWVMAGAGSIILHELLDALKSFPVIGSKYSAFIDMISGLLAKKP